MRHKKGLKKLGRATDQRLAILYSEAAALIKHGKIKLTLTRAKEARKIAEKLISHAKRNDLHARREASRIIKDKSILKQLFELGSRFEGRPGGFTRITRIGFRRGDAAPMALLELV
jgi:large subunit ribosomal protein L17